MAEAHEEPQRLEKMERHLLPDDLRGLPNSTVDTLCQDILDGRKAITDFQKKFIARYITVCAQLNASMVPPFAALTVQPLVTALPEHKPGELTADEEKEFFSQVTTSFKVIPAEEVKQRNDLRTLIKAIHALPNAQRHEIIMLVRMLLQRAAPVEAPAELILSNRTEEEQNAVDVNTTTSKEYITKMTAALRGDADQVVANPEEAVRYARLATHAFPENPDILSVAGMCFFQRGLDKSRPKDFRVDDFEKALDLFQDAMTVIGNPPYIKIPKYQKLLRDLDKKCDVIRKKLREK